jgi:phosphopantothenoylcysteine decarboxylase/phosphopantothenate--cysteine ligase
MGDREILIGVTGGIAAYKTASLVSKLVQAGFGATVIMTRAATKFVGPATFEALSGRPVYSKVFGEPDKSLGSHIELVQRAELLCVAPATADFLGKSAHGIADDLLSTLYLSFSGIVLMAPAMNHVMWEKPSVQRNIRRLEEDGVELVPPEEGWLSCREVGAGRMAEPETILAALDNALPPAP